MLVQIANTKKHQTSHQIIQENVTLVASDNNHSPLCTQVGFQKYIHDVNLMGISPCDLADVISITTVVPPGTMSANAAAMTVAFHQDNQSSRFMLEKELIILYMDVKTITKTKAYTPATFSESRMQIEGFQDFLGSFIRTAHPQRQEYTKCVKYMCSKIPEFKHLITAKYGKAGPALLAFVFHNAQRQWFQDQYEADFWVKAFKLYDKLRSFIENQKVEDLVPYFRHINELTLLVNGSPFSALTQQDGLMARHPLGDATWKLVNNPNLDPRFTANNAFVKKCKQRKITEGIAQEKTQGKCIPVVPNREARDNERCLLWHIKGSCYDNFRKKYDHVLLPNNAKEEIHNYAHAMHA